MEDSLKGLLVTLAMVSLFATSMLSYIVIFPQEQGVSFTDLRSNDVYLSMQNNSNSQLQTQLSSIQSTTQNTTEQWDITQGFMGSNALKQNTLTGSGSSDRINSNIFSILILMATKLFSSGSPIVYSLIVLFILSGSVIIYQVIQFVRQGR